MRTTTFAHCAGHDLWIKAGISAGYHDSGDTIELSVGGDDQGQVTLFLSEDQANELLIALSNGVTKFRNRPRAGSLSAASLEGEVRS